MNKQWVMRVEFPDGTSCYQRLSMNPLDCSHTEEEALKELTSTDVAEVHKRAVGFKLIRVDEAECIAYGVYDEGPWQEWDVASMPQTADEARNA